MGVGHVEACWVFLGDFCSQLQLEIFFGVACARMFDRPPHLPKETPPVSEGGNKGPPRESALCSDAPAM